MSCASSGRVFASVLAALLLFACGDDTTATSDTDGSTGMPATSTTDESTSGSTSDEGTTATDPDDSSTTAVADASTTVGESSSSGSSSGEPNEAPEAVADFYRTDTAARPLTVDGALGVLSNDADPEGEGLIVVAFDETSEAGGTVQVEADGSFVYDAPTPFWGEDAFTYTIEDPSGAAATARVRVAVAPTTESLSEVVDATAGVRIEGPSADARLGQAVAGGADVNGDGFADTIFGADDALDGRGAAYVVFGGPDAAVIDGASVEAGIGGFAILGPAAASSTGFAVAMPGDVNGDGFGDVAVGVTDGDGPGGVYVVFGSDSPGTVDLDALGLGGFAITGGATFGQSVGAAGDVNDDGLQDVLVGDPGANGGSGSAVVVFGKADADPVDGGALGSAGFRVEGTTNGALGAAVAVAGDVNIDGFDDVILGARAAAVGGRVFIVYGKPDTATVTEDDLMMDDAAGIVVSGAEPFDLFGQSVAAAGDFNGDGRADVIFGGPGIDIGDQIAAGQVFVLYGGTALTSTTIDALIAGEGGFALDGASQFDFAGWSVGGAGDIDRDGYDDVLIGAQGVDLAGGNAGRIFVLYGGPDLAPGNLSDFAVGEGGFILDGESSNQFAGWAVHGSSDVNGDGFDDLSLGFPEGASDGGLGFVAFGGNYTGADRIGFTADGDVLTGGPGAETLVGGPGDDEIVAGGGADVVSGGAGNDVIVVLDGGFRRIDGGSGTDTLRLDGAGFSLDLGNFFDVAITDIEEVDLTGDGDNTLFLATHQLLALSSTSNTLRVRGDAGDQLVADLAGAGFVDQGSDGMVRTYSNGVASLVVDDAVEPFVSVD